MVQNRPIDSNHGHRWSVALRVGTSQGGSARAGCDVRGLSSTRHPGAHLGTCTRCFGVPGPVPGGCATWCCPRRVRHLVLCRHAVTVLLSCDCATCLQIKHLFKSRRQRYVLPSPRHRCPTWRRGRPARCPLHHVGIVTELPVPVRSHPRTNSTAFEFAWSTTLIQVDSQCGRWHLVTPPFSARSWTSPSVVSSFLKRHAPRSLHCKLTRIMPP